MPLTCSDFTTFAYTFKFSFKYRIVVVCTLLGFMAGNCPLVCLRIPKAILCESKWVPRVLLPQPPCHSATLWLVALVKLPLCWAQLSPQVLLLHHHFGLQGEDMVLSFALRLENRQTLPLGCHSIEYTLL